MNLFVTFVIITFIGQICSQVLPCFEQGSTWSAQGQLEVIVEVESDISCYSLCKAREECLGFTWYGSSTESKINNVCVLFHTLEDSEDCQQCISGVKDRCTCSQPKECVTFENNFLGAVSANSENGCLTACRNLEGCNFYTWYSPENNFIKNECFLFSKCSQTTDCPQGCYTGSKDCLIEPCMEGNYFVLKEADRKHSYLNLSAQFCDLYDHPHTSPDWKGMNWYRFVEPAGTQMPEFAVEAHHCGTDAAGWFNGTHPEVLGQVVDGKACFSWNGKECWGQKDIQLLNCGEFYLYHLDEVGVLWRYCAI